MIAVVGMELGVLPVALPHTDPLLLRAAGTTEALAVEMVVAVVVLVNTAVAVVVVVVIPVGVRLVVVFHGEVGVVEEVAMVGGVGEGGVVAWALLR